MKQQNGWLLCNHPFCCYAFTQLEISTSSENCLIESTIVVIMIHCAMGTFIHGLLQSKIEVA